MWMRLVLVLSLALPLFVFPTATTAQTAPPAAQWVPHDAVICLEVSRPKALLELLTGREMTQAVTSSPFYQSLLSQPKFNEFLTVIRFLETSLGTDWRTGLARFVGGGITIAVCPQDTVVAIVDAQDEQILQKIHEIFLNRAAKQELRWCITQYPTQSSAQDAEMSLAEYENFVFHAAHVQAKDPIQYWRTVHRDQEKIRTFLNKKKILHVIAKDTDLTVSVAGRTWINCSGRENFPDGEVFTGPTETSAEGHISYSFPGSYNGREVNDIELYFKKGAVVKATASKGENLLRTMLAMDPGAKRLGEFAFGTNYGVKNYTKNTLFDEKIGGTIHLAVGSGYPETGSKNKSSLHWDMVCDLRKNGEVYADDELIYKNGRFLNL